MLLPGLISVVSSSSVVGVAYFGGFNGRVEGVIRNLTHQLRNAGLLDPQRHEIGGPDDILAKDRIVTPGEVVFLHSGERIPQYQVKANRPCGRHEGAK